MGPDLGQSYIVDSFMVVVVGGVTKLIPLTGVTLPFVSYGGSSMFSCWIAVGLVGNVHAASRRRIS